MIDAKDYPDNLYDATGLPYLLVPLKQQLAEAQAELDEKREQNQKLLQSGLSMKARAEKAEAQRDALQAALDSAQAAKP